MVNSCNREQPLSISAENFTEKQLKACDTASCPEITVNYISIPGDEDRSVKINSVVKEFIIEALYLGDETSNPTAKSIEEAATQFVNMYHTHTAEFPDMQLEYYVDINIIETFLTNEVLCLEMHQYLFTGGAHGYGATFFDIFDAQTGDKISLEDLFSDMSAFTSLAEMEFRKDHNIPKDGSINANGFWFEDDTFYLPESIGLRESNLVLIYNQYDIASYAEGPIELEIPLSKIKSYLSISIQ
jgi:hypothetical protein